MDNIRYQRWVQASHAVARIEPFMTLTIQGLGKIDSELFEKDQRHHEMLNENSPTSQEGVDLTDSITLSYLWILGAYEVVRTLNQRFREKPAQTETRYLKSQELKKLFERIRIPLAKFEPSSRHKKTDFKIAYPALNSTHGIAWQVAGNHFISRDELAEALIEFVEWLRDE